MWDRSNGFNLLRDGMLWGNPMLHTLYRINPMWDSSMLRANPMLYNLWRISLLWVNPMWDSPMLYNLRWDNRRLNFYRVNLMRVNLMRTNLMWVTLMRAGLSIPSILHFNYTRNPINVLDAIPRLFINALCWMRDMYSSFNWAGGGGNHSGVKFDL